MNRIRFLGFCRNGFAFQETRHQCLLPLARNMTFVGSLDLFSQALNDGTSDPRVYIDANRYILI